MPDSFLHQVVTSVVATVVAAATAATAAVGTRSSFADEVESRVATSTAPPAPSATPSAPAPASPPVSGPRSVGRDVGWPNCPTGMGIPARRTLGEPMPPASARFVLVGLTNGPAFFPNPCLRDQAASLRRLRLWTSAYAVVTYPSPGQLRQYGGAGPRDASDLTGRLYNSGWAQAQLNVQNMRDAGLRSPMLWLDVETVRPPAPWSGDVDANRTVLEGSMAAYRGAGLRLGVYSTAYLWRTVVGDAQYRLPEWRAAGPTSRSAAERQCTGPAIQGGDPVIGQWSSVDVDYDVLCPGRPESDVLADWFAAPRSDLALTAPGR